MTKTLNYDQWRMNKSLSQSFKLIDAMEFRKFNVYEFLFRGRKAISKLVIGIKLVYNFKNITYFGRLIIKNGFLWFEAFLGYILPLQYILQL